MTATIKRDPNIAFGDPTIRSVRTSVIAERYFAGETVADLADDYGILEEEVILAVNFEREQSRIDASRRTLQTRAKLRNRT